MSLADQARTLADRIAGLAETDRIIRLKPDTGLLVASALRAYAARPPPDEIVKVICRVKCPQEKRLTCMMCIGLANTVIALCSGRPTERPPGT